MKILGLDLGDVWIGIAISDPLGITCKPHTTVTADELDTFLADFLAKELISKVVVGCPVTVGAGAKSEQTNKIIAHKQALEAKFPTSKAGALPWVLWDERFSSKRAEQLQKGIPTKEEKRRSHSVAASFILQSYLDYLAFSKTD